MLGVAAPQRLTAQPAASPPPSPAGVRGAQPAPSATPAYRYIYTPSPSPQTTPFPGPGAPQIFEIDMSDQTLVTPGQLRVRVVTNREVVVVTARAMGYEIKIPRSEPGIFAAATEIGGLPAYLTNRNYDVDFVAATQDGRTATVTLQLGLR